MKTENDHQWKTPPKFVKMLRKLFPRDLQEDAMDALTTRYESVPKLAPQVAGVARIWQSLPTRANFRSPIVSLDVAVYVLSVSD